MKRPVGRGAAVSPTRRVQMEGDELRVQKHRYAHPDTGPYSSRHRTISYCRMPCSLVRLSVDLAFARYHVRFGSKADICNANRHVRFTPNSGHVRCKHRCPLSANSDIREMTCAKRKTTWLVAKAEFRTGSGPGQGELRSQDGGTHNAMWREATIEPTLNALSQHKIANDHGT